MGWSTTAPTLPSGSSWISQGSASMTRNYYSATIEVSVARLSGSDYCIYVGLTFGNGSAGSYHQNDNKYLQPEGSYVGGLAGGYKHVFYYYGSAASGSVNVSVGDSSAGYQTGDALVSVSIPAKLEYTITYYANNDTTSKVEQSHTSGVATPISGNGFTKTGHHFVIWNTAANGSGTNYSPGTNYNSDGNLTLYAQWAANQYTVTFNPGDGTVSPTSKSVTYGGTYGTLPTPTLRSHQFLGWFTAATGGTQITSSTTVQITSDQTLYAHWLKLNIPLFVNVNNQIHQVEKAYVNVNGVVKEATVYANVNGVIKELT